MRARAVSSVVGVLGLLGLLALLWVPRGLPKPAPESTPAASDPHPSAHASLTAEVAAATPPSTFGGDVRVTVLAEGVPATGAVVTLTREASRTFMSFPLPDGGVQIIQRVPPGRYHAKAVQPGYRAASGRAQVESGRTSTITLTLRRETRLEGTVVDKSGRPVDGASVHVLQPAFGGPGGDDLTARSDGQGRYALGGLPSGPFDVRVRHEGYRAAWIRGLVASGIGETLRGDVVLEAGEPIAGRVLDACGAPLAGATVVALNDEVSTVGVDVDGRFRMDGLGSSPIGCFATAPGYGAEHRFGVAPGTLDLEFRLSRAASVSGRVDVEPPPRRFMLRLSRLEKAQGRYLPLAEEPCEGGVFDVRGVSAGDYRMELEAEGYEALDTPVITLAPGESLTGIRIRARRR